MLNTSIGHYLITDKIGEGGMGEVFRARDTRLNREVALKLLPEAFASDLDRMQRFSHEAQVLASLNHPNIAAIYGLEDTGTIKALVMELVEGEDLSERCARGPIPLDEAIPIARQIAEALESAHERGIVHRDLKPANIKVRPDGTVKVLDFGLAKALSPEISGLGTSSLANSPTIASPVITQSGMILGTAAYMAPEQARGRVVDKRADIWAFGCVLFELLSGQKPFTGETASEILASIIKDEPNWELLPESVSPIALSVLRRCLKKEPSDRLHDAADVRILLGESESAKEEKRPISSVFPRREGFAWLLAITAILIAVILGLRSLSVPVEEMVIRFEVSLPPEQSIAFLDAPALALSPDGRKLAFTTGGASGQTTIQLRSFNQAEIRKLPGTEGGSSPFFSPDGESLGFFAEGKLKTISLDTGAILTLADAPTPRGGVWGSDGTIYYSPEYAAGIWNVPAMGGLAREVISPDTENGERTFRWPDLLPGNQACLFTVGSLDSPNDYSEAQVVAFSLETEKRHHLVDRASMVRFLPPDRLVYTREGSVFAVAFNPDDLKVVGQPIPVLESVAGDSSSGASYFALASNGTLAVVRGAGSQANRLLTLVDREGNATRLPLSARGFRHPRFSPDGKEIAFTVGGTASGVGSDSDVWLYSLENNSLNRLTFEGRAYPLWAPDGDRMVYQDPRSLMILERITDGTGLEKQLSLPSPDPLLPSSLDPSGQIMAITLVGSTNEIYLMTPGEDPKLFERDASTPAISPDGRWIAYSSPAVGNSNVYVRPVNGPGKWQVSPEIGGYPRWSRDGKELYYLGTGVTQRPLIVVPVESSENFSAGPPRVLIPDLSRYMTATAPQLDWDAAPSGDHFIFIEVERALDEGTRIDVSLYWGKHIAVPGTGQ